MDNGYLTNVHKEHKCLVYYSLSNEFWVAHGLHVDQIGTGISMLSALVDFLVGVENLKDLANKREDIAFWREAPKKIKDRAKKAIKLPLELYSMAHKKVIGQWPKEVKLVTRVNKKKKDYALVMD